MLTPRLSPTATPFSCDRPDDRGNVERQLQGQWLLVSAVVVDRASEVIVALRGDNAGPHTMENAGCTAYIERSFLHFNRCLRQAVRR